ncbi:MAG: PTS sugar transporter subunit IIA [Spirochaetes bacterium]|nr:PTS sugar transporter subunit IIA [Spirochaetota bacterium]
MSNIIEFTDVKFIKKIESTEKYAAIEELAMTFEKSDVCTDINRLIKALKEREEILSTGIGLEIAIPHAKIDVVNKMSFAVGICPKGLEFDSMDGIPVKIIILVAAGEKQHKEYLGILSHIMTILKDDAVKEKIISASSSQEVFEIFKNS